MANLNASLHWATVSFLSKSFRFSAAIMGDALKIFNFVIMGSGIDMGHFRLISG